MLDSKKNYSSIESLDNEIVISLYRNMVKVRKFESLAYKMYMSKRIYGFCHICWGQEAAIAAISANLKNDSDVMTSYRCHGYSILLDSPKACIAELLADTRGAAGGLGGSMHIMSPENRFWGGHGIVGAPFSIGAGLGFAKKYNNESGISIAIIGDGAFNQGQVYEVFNMACLYSLPVLFVIENNQYAMGTSLERSSANVNLYERSRPFGIESSKTDGMDVYELYNKIAHLKQEIQKQQKPYLLEIETYRYCGHSMSDPGTTYRKRDEINKVKQENDAIKRASVHIDQSIIDKIDQELDIEVNELENELSIIQHPDSSAIHKNILNK